MLPGSKGGGRWVCGLSVPLQPGLWCWGAAWGRSDPTVSSWSPSPGVSTAAPVPALLQVQPK